MEADDAMDMHEFGNLVNPVTKNPVEKTMASPEAVRTPSAKG